MLFPYTKLHLYHANQITVAALSMTWKTECCVTEGSLSFIYYLEYSYSLIDPPYNLIIELKIMCRYLGTWIHGTSMIMKPLIKFSADAAKNAEENAFVARNAELWVGGKLEHFLSMIKQCPEQRVAEQGNLDDISFAIFTNIHHQMTFWDIFWDVVLLIKAEPHVSIASVTPDCTL